MTEKKTNSIREYIHFCVLVTPGPAQREGPHFFIVKTTIHNKNLSKERKKRKKKLLLNRQLLKVFHLNAHPEVDD